MYPISEMYFCLNFEAESNQEIHVTPTKFDMLYKACNRRPLDIESVSIYAQQ